MHNVSDWFFAALKIMPGFSKIEMQIGISDYTQFKTVRINFYTRFEITAGHHCGGETF